MCQLKVATPVIRTNLTPNSAESGDLGQARSKLAKNRTTASNTPFWATRGGGMMMIPERSFTTQSSRARPELRHHYSNPRVAEPKRSSVQNNAGPKSLRLALWRHCKRLDGLASQGGRTTVADARVNSRCNTICACPGFELGKYDLTPLPCFSAFPLQQLSRAMEGTMPL